MKYKKCLPVKSSCIRKQTQTISLLEEGAKSEVYVTKMGFQPTTAYFVNKNSTI